MISIILLLMPLLNQSSYMDVLIEAMHSDKYVIRALAEDYAFKLHRYARQHDIEVPISIIANKLKERQIKNVSILIKDQLIKTVKLSDLYYGDLFMTINNDNSLDVRFRCNRIINKISNTDDAK